jgi:Domain of unknown function (DUF4406)
VALTGRKLSVETFVGFLDSADEIAMLPEWAESKGASAEKAAAETIGLPVRYLKYYQKVMLVYQLCTNFSDI